MSCSLADVDSDESLVFNVFLSVCFEIGEGDIRLL